MERTDVARANRCHWRSGIAVLQAAGRTEAPRRHYSPRYKFHPKRQSPGWSCRRGKFFSWMSCYHLAFKWRVYLLAFILGFRNGGSVNHTSIECSVTFMKSSSSHNKAWFFFISRLCGIVCLAVRPAKVFYQSRLRVWPNSNQQLYPSHTQGDRR